MKKNYIESDVLIIGAGFIGQIMALMLASSKIKVTLVDKNKFRRYDTRTTAISQGSARILDSIDVWSSLKEYSEGINKILVSDQQDTDYLTFDSSKLNEGMLGYIIENKIFRRIINQKIIQNSYIKTYEEHEILKIINSGKKKHNKIFAESKYIKFLAELIIAADGRNSATRRLVNLKYYEHKYKQNAYVFNITHKNKHNGIALERFFPNGPLAILPMRKNTRSDPNRSSVVWTVDNNLGDFTKIDQGEFLREFSYRYNEFFGRLLHLSKPSVYPLNLIYAYEIISEKIVLVGDAAQGIHPIAGQGFNLGLRDCKMLNDLVLDAKLTGQPINSDFLLNKYQTQRTLDRRLFIEATDKLNKLFSNNFNTIKFVRKFGLRLINKSDIAKKYLMLNAMGLRNLSAPFLT